MLCRAGEDPRILCRAFPGRPAGHVVCDAADSRDRSIGRGQQLPEVLEGLVPGGRAPHGALVRTDRRIHRSGVQILLADRRVSAMAVLHGCDDRRGGSCGTDMPADPGKGLRGREGVYEGESVE